MAYDSYNWISRKHEERLGFWGLGRGFRSARLRFALVAVGGIASILGAGQTARAVECPNEALRVAQSATHLPDCRAYEQVSPLDGTPYLEDPENEVHAARASSAGGGITWFSYNPLSSALGGGFYDLSTRTSSGWATQSVTPRQSTSNGPYFACVPAMFFSADLSRSVLMDGFDSARPSQGAERGACGSNAPALVEDEPEGFQNVFLRDDLTGSYRLVDVTPPAITPADATFQDASEDFSHVVFEDGAKLTADAPAGASLYAWVDGNVSLVTVLPDGTPSTGTLPEAVSPMGNLLGGAPYTHLVSADGTRIIFETEGKLYLRENVGEPQSVIGLGGECLESARACTVQIDASQAEGAGGGGSFVAASASDTKIFFTDGPEAKLTADTLEGSGQHLYEYDTATGELSDLTPAGALGFQGFSGISQDGGYLYLVASAAFDGGIASRPNLYVFHAGTVKLIATLSEQDNFDWIPAYLTARVSSDGRYLAFNSIEPLKVPTEERDEIYRYDAVASVLTCVSCDPGGAPPAGSAAIARAEPTSESGAPNYLQRQLLDDGRVFFDTATALVAGAANGKVNVYEYNGGDLSLISSGSSDTNSYFYDASSSGEDVYFVTTQHLVGEDTANGMRLYDARVNGGFPEPEALRSPCGGEECRGPASESSSYQSVVTTALGASGNLGVKHTSAGATRKQKLEQALRACRRFRRLRRRAACTRRAHVRYGSRSTLATRGGGK